ncbi:MAG: methyltransferase domain-containing protein [Deltaproteobacteria bacterium]|nr:methyltransferase domain-containing protein [Deltaproteobacteria bacterium]
MNQEKHRLGRNFGRQAGQYDHYALVQRRLAEGLAHSLAERSRNFPSILEIGCGTGYFTGLLRRAFPKACITALDLSPEAIRTAQARLAEADGIAWVVADGEQAVPGPFDLITASSVFQWFSQPETACRLYWENLQPGGLLAFTALGPRTFRELAASFAQAGKIHPEKALPLIPAQNFAAGADWHTFLQRAGFKDITLQEELWLEGYPDLWAFLRAVRGMGATSTRPAYLSRRLLGAVVDHYETFYRQNGTIGVTYDIISLCGVKN